MIFTKDGWPLEMVIGKPIKNALRTVAQIIQRNVDWEKTALHHMQGPINRHVSTVLARMYELRWINSGTLHNVSAHFDPTQNKVFPMLADSLRPYKTETILLNSKTYVPPGVFC